MIIDVHHHCIPPTALDRIFAEPGLYGARVEETAGERDLVFGNRRPAGVFRLPWWRKANGLEERKAFLRQIGADGAVLSLAPGVNFYGLPLEQEERLCRTINDGLAEWIGGESMFRGMATVPLQDGPAATEELRRSVQDLHLRGAMILTHIGGKNLDSPHLEPFWAAAEALDVPIFIHPNPSDLATKERLEAYGLPILVGVPFDITIAASCLVMSGLFDRHPHLKVILSHGGGYLSTAFGRLNRGYGVVGSAPTYAAKPAEAYLRCFYYDTVIFHPEPLYRLVRLVGADRMLLGTDYPFPGSAQAVEELHLAAEESQAILGGGAELFGFARKEVSQE